MLYLVGSNPALRCIVNKSKLKSIVKHQNVLRFNLKPKKNLCMSNWSPSLSWLTAALNSTPLTYLPTVLTIPLCQARTKPWPQHLSSSEQLYQWEVFSHFRSTFLTPIRAEAGGRSAWSDVPRSLSALSHSIRGRCDGGRLYGNALYSSRHNENSAAFKSVAVMGLFRWWLM